MLAAARELLPWMTEIRRDLHMHPELGLEEHRTCGRIESLLDEMGVPHRRVAGTGVVGDVAGGAAGRRVALRADLDALPLFDGKDVPYRSQIPGRMHACGHDVHTTVLLGATRLLAERAKDLEGSVRLLFQPAEETVGGARLLIEAGALEGVDAVFGLHVDPEIPVGAFGLHRGQRNASSDAIHLVIEGKSGHGAYPAGGIDAIVVAAQVISALQSVISRNVDARDSAVLTLGTIRGGTQNNILARRVELTGTLRTLDPRIRELVQRRIRETSQGVAAGLGGRAELHIEPGYDALINDDWATDVVEHSAVELVGSDRVSVAPRPNMGVEDFAFYLQHVPGSFFALGVRNEARGIVHSIHHELFDADEECLAYGAAVQVLNALSALEPRSDD